MREMMDFGIWKHRREEMVREAEGDYTTAKLVHDRVLRMDGFRLGGGVCRIRIYRGHEPGDAPVVICSELPDDPGEPAANIRLLAEHIAGEVVRRHFPEGLPNLPRPLIWIEQYLTFEGDPLEFVLVDFASWRPRPAGLGTDGHFALGTARREKISGNEVRGLVA